jgi:hypothetical protein
MTNFFRSDSASIANPQRINELLGLTSSQSTQPVDIRPNSQSTRFPTQGSQGGKIKKLNLRQYRSGFEVNDKDAFLDPSVTWRYFVETENGVSADDLRNELERNTGFPVPGSAVSFGSGTALAMVRSLTIDQVDATHFNVEVQASVPQGGDNSNRENRDNNEDTPQNNQIGPEIEVSYQSISVPMETARFYGFAEDGLDFGAIGMRHPDQMPLNQIMPVTNSALEPYDPPAEIEVQITVVRLSYISFWFNLGTAWDGMTNVVNSGPFTINWPQLGFSISAPSRWQAMLKSLGGRFVRSDQGNYWQLNAEILFNPLTWAVRLLDQGYSMLDDARLKKISENPLKTPIIPRTRFRGRDGSAPTGPILLDGTGKPSDIRRMGRIVP